MESLLFEFRKIEVGTKTKWAVKYDKSMILSRAMKRVWIARTITNIRPFSVAAPIIVFYDARNKMKAFPFLNIRGIFYWGLFVAVAIVLFDFFSTTGSEKTTFDISLFTLFMMIIVGVQLILLLPMYNLVLEEIKKRFENGS